MQSYTHPPLTQYFQTTLVYFLMTQQTITCPLIQCPWERAVFCVWLPSVLSVVWASLWDDSVYDWQIETVCHLVTYLSLSHWGPQPCMWGCLCIREAMYNYIWGALSLCMKGILQTWEEALCMLEAKYMSGALCMWPALYVWFILYK